MTWSDEQQLELCAEDRQILDRLVECGFDVSQLELLTEEERRRAQTLMSLLGLLEDYPVENAEDTLLHATLAQIDRYEDHRADRMNIDPAVSVRRIRFPDFITVAAVILIMASLAWPLLTYVQNASTKSACANNQRLTNIALRSYSSDYGTTPTAQASFGSSLRNVLNLAPLIDHGYCERGHVSCPGHDSATGDSSYSVHHHLPGHATNLDVLRGTVILGDRNPVIDAYRRGAKLPPLTVSPDHGGHGQYVLYSDGSTVWLEQPVIRQNDNIWLPNGADDLESSDEPVSATDVFLMH